MFSTQYTCYICGWSGDEPTPVFIEESQTIQDGIYRPEKAIYDLCCPGCGKTLTRIEKDLRPK